MRDRTLRGKAALVGVGETAFYRHGRSPDPEFKMALQAILAACADAGLDPRRIDGFASYSNDRNLPTRLATALGLPELRWANMVWAGGGGGCCAAVANAAAAVATGIADCVVVFRALAQGQTRRFGTADAAAAEVSGDAAFEAPYGLLSPAQRFAMRSMRFMHEHGIARSALRAIAMASYHHAQLNPRAVMHGRPLTEGAYDASRWIVEPLRLNDCCMENDGAAAMIVVAAEQAEDFPHRPAYLLGAAQGSGRREGASAHNLPDYAGAGFASVAPHAFRMAGLKPDEIDVLQAYENFTAGVLVALVEHGFFPAEAANEFLVLENLIAPHGRLPLNTSGGNLAECYMHGMAQQVEAVRQLRGTSTAQVPDARTAMVIGGPLANPVSSLILGTGEML